VSHRAIPTNSGCTDAWRLTVRVSPIGDLEVCCAWRLRATPSDVATTEVVLHDLDMHGLQGFDDISKTGLLVFLELWLRTYPLTCGTR